ncbi:MAG TPA: hypothetical protein VKZ18_09095 [Polyangia bacterium]|nr:hypothetical protein [Polyangia bacterium]
MRRGVTLLALLTVGAHAAEARATLLTWIGGRLAIGAVEKVQPAITQTLKDTDAVLTKQEGQIQNVATTVISQASAEVGKTLDHTDGILAQRLLQVQLGTDQVIDNGVDKVNGAARQRIAQLGGLVDKTLVGVDKDVSNALDKVDGILQGRIGDLGRIVTSTVDQADQAVAARVEQIDEAAGRRLANVDVIATKQRLGLERTVLRATWVIALVVFVIAVLKSLWNEYLAEEEAIARTPPGRERARKYATVLWRPLLRHLAAAGLVAAVLAFVPERLPMAAVKDQNALVAQYARELTKSVSALDWTRVRFDASQLEMLQPDDIDRYRLLEAKADLLRDLLARRASLAAPATASAILTRVQAVERIAAGRLDPDAETARAMILWQRGTTRRDEHQAATLAGRALWSTPAGFTLSPMARLIVEAYLHAPEPEPADDPSGELSSNAGLTAIAAAALADPPGSPFEAETALFHAMATLDETSSVAFVAMLTAQEKVAAGDAGAKDERNRQADLIVKAWETFDRQLTETPVLAEDPLVLNAFRLNDAVLSHALWYTTAHDTVAWPPQIDEIASKSRRLAVAPARVAWATRYATFLTGPARTLIELQESQRFLAYEEATIAVEEGYGRPAAPAGKRKGKTPVPTPTAAAVHPALRAATAAAALGLYQTGPGGRQPVALAIAGKLADLEERAHAGLADAKKKTDSALERLDRAVNSKINGVTVDAMSRLRALLEARGVQLI